MYALFLLATFDRLGFCQESQILSGVEV
jgi:hypothetical protein